LSSNGERYKKVNSGYCRARKRNRKKASLNAKTFQQTNRAKGSWATTNPSLRRARRRQTDRSWLHPLRDAAGQGWEENSFFRAVKKGRRINSQSWAQKEDNPCGVRPTIAARRKTPREKGSPVRSVGPRRNGNGRFRAPEKSYLLYIRKTAGNN